MITGGAALYAGERFGVIEAGEAGSAIGNLAGEAVGAVISIIPNAVPEIIDAVGRTVATTRNNLQGKEVAVITGITIVTLSLTTYWGLKGLLLGRRM